MIPAELAEAHGAEPPAAEAFAASFSNRKRHVLAVGGAETSETRDRRIAKVLSELR